MNHRGTELTLVKSPDLARIPSAETLLVSSRSSSSPPPLPVLLPGPGGPEHPRRGMSLGIYLAGQAKPWQPWQIQSGRLIGLA